MKQERKKKKCVKEEEEEIAEICKLIIKRR